MFNNPLKYVDPSGHWGITFNDGAGGVGHSSGPRFSLRMNLPLSLTGREGKLVLNDLGTDELDAAQYIPVHSKKYADRFGSLTAHSNLCGHISIETVFEAATGVETVMGGNEVLAMLWELYETSPSKGTYLYRNDETGLGWAERINALPGWTAWSEWVTPTERYEVYLAALRSGTYIVNHFTLNTLSAGIAPSHLEIDVGDPYVGHFVVVTGVSPDGVSVINPYNDAHQFYSWDAWAAGAGGTLFLRYAPPPGIYYRQTCDL